MPGRTSQTQMTKLGTAIEPLRCLECGKSSDREARGWKALVGGGFEDEPVEVGIFCPECAAREFGL